MCKRPRGAGTAENQTTYGVQYTCNTGHLSDPTRDDPRWYE